MTQRKRTTKKKIPPLKFELKRSSVAGVGIVLFCLFLWMFLFGIWTGQTLLSPYSVSDKNLLGKRGKSSVPFIKAVEKKRIVLKDSGGKSGTE